MKINYWEKLDPGFTFHAYNRAVGGTNLFAHESDYTRFLRLMEKYFIPYMDVVAYCLMPNHYHLLVKVKSKNNYQPLLGEEETKAVQKLINDQITIDQFLADQFRRMFSAYSMKINRKYNRRGPLFSPKVKRIVIPKPEKVRNMICYLHHNPIHHKFKKNYEEWSYSSYHTLRSTLTTDLSREYVLELMNGLDGFDRLFNYPNPKN